jgi:O-succinylbenzoate synthase
VEYLEQPLPPDRFADLLKLSARYVTPLALDESVATLEQLKTCYEQGWRGIYVIKPAIAGFPSHLRQFCQTYAIDAVFSSVFETAIGRQAGLKLAAELGNCDRAMGYGIAHWFNESEDYGLNNIETFL